MLTTLEIVKQELGINPSDTDSDVFLERKIKEISQMFVSMIGYDIKFKENIEEHISQTPLRRRIVVEHVPLLEVHEVKYKDEVVDPQEYFIEDQKGGFITKFEGSWQHTAIGTNNINRSPQFQPIKTYKITYDAGYVTPKQAEDDPLLERTLPYDVESAVISSVVASFNYRGVDEGISSIGVGDGSTSFSGTSDLISGNRTLTNLFMNVVNKYKKTTVL